ncbi:rho GTPase-activating protein 25 [Tachyglossus aculeatus]|uniref:rho GTPase-activating protein 25 n=1 Tax=Tachyglossus aculeatus TaxID=9261 RepID=UPI0018F7A9F3|nr:rho GTPase-activating protein 25 [Tachyglossus aculeatus]
MSVSQPGSLFPSAARSRSVMSGEPVTPGSPPSAGPATQDRPLKIGWLKKQRSIVKNWQQRYFVLKGRQLFYYKDEEEAKPQGSMCLLGSTIKEMTSNPEEPGKFVFEVIPASGEQGWTGQDSFTLMAGSQAEMDDWVKSIRRVAAAPSGAVFGQRLADTVAYERKFGHHPVPILMEKCAAFIRDHGLDEEGVFRLPGQDNLVKQLRDAFDAGERPSFHRDTDVHTVASLFKLYLRELPDPVVPWSQYENFLLCGQLLDTDRPKGHEELLNQVSDLPKDNYNLLSFICRFLHEIQLNCRVNKMSVENLATVIGVNLIRPQIEDPAAIMRGTPQIQRVMTALISEHEALFPKSKDAPPSPPPAQKSDPKKPPVARSSVGWDAAEAPGPLPHTRDLGPTASEAVASHPGGPPGGGVNPGENGREREGPEAWKLQSRKRTQTLPSRKCFLSTAIQEDQGGPGVKAEIFDSDFWSPSPDPKAGGGHKRTLSQDLGAILDLGWTPSRHPSCPPASREAVEDPRGSEGASGGLSGGPGGDPQPAGGPQERGSPQEDLNRVVLQLRREIEKQKKDFEEQIKGLQKENFDVWTKVLHLTEEKKQEQEKLSALEVKLWDAERAREEAEKRNKVLEGEIEKFLKSAPTP